MDTLFEAYCSACGLKPVYAMAKSDGVKTTVFFPDLNEFLRLQDWVRDEFDRDSRKVHLSQLSLFDEGGIDSQDEF